MNCVVAVVGVNQCPDNEEQKLKEVINNNLDSYDDLKKGIESVLGDKAMLVERIDVLLDEDENRY